MSSLRTQTFCTLGIVGVRCSCQLFAPFPDESPANAPDGEEATDGDSDADSDADADADGPVDADNHDADVDEADRYYKRPPA